ncbi:MAG: tetratricopeptide repeat protein, partial [Anaerolineales bacterium]|nr:tetratricopeptide repeat protein [Anaerolineales bacterium]
MTDQNPTQPELHLRLFGGLFIERGGVPVTGLSTQKEALLLAYLALNPQTHGREQLANLLWDDPTAERDTKQALSNLRTMLSRLRKVLGDYLEITRQTVAIRPERVWVDVLAFAQLVAEAEAAWPQETAVEKLNTAVALTNGGDFLAGVVNDSLELDNWQLFTAERLRDQQIFARHKLTTHALYHRAYQAGLAHGRVLLALDPLREESHVLLMRLLARSGQRTAALQQYETCAHILADELRISPAQETQELADRLRTSLAEGEQAQLQLPRLETSFVGRAALLAQVDEALNHGRVVTILGLGGVGKTRLALEVAYQRRFEYLHGVYFVGLEGASTAQAIPRLLGQRLGLTFESEHTASVSQQLLDYLQARELLLVLDNMETVLGDLGTVAFVQKLLRHAPHVTLLVTSREPLRLQAEWLVRVNGLSFAPAGEAVSDLNTAVAQYEAVALFHQRAAQQGLDLTAEPLTAVLESCRLVAGLPLALELLAALLGQYALAEINQYIRHSLAQLAAPFHDRPERHHSLYAVFDYSWRLLTADEQTALVWLSVVRGAFAAEVFTAVVNMPTAVLAALSSKSLVQTAANGQYALHPLIQQFATEKWAERGGPDPAVLHRHAAYYLGQMAAQKPHLYTETMAQAIAAGALFGNVPAAWHTAVAQQQTALLWASWEPLHVLTHFWGGRAVWGQMLAEASEVYPTAVGWRVLRGQVLADSAEYEPALALLQTVVDEAERGVWTGLADGEDKDEDEPRPWLVRAHLAQAKIHHTRGHFAQAISHSQQALALLQTLPPAPALAAEAYLRLGRAYLQQNDHQHATPALHEARTRYAALGQPYYEAEAWHSLGVQAHYQGQVAQSMAYYEQALALKRRAGGQLSVGTILSSMGLLANELRQHEQARAYYEEALQIQCVLGDREGQSQVLHNLGLLAQHVRQFEQAQTYYEQSLLIAKMVGNQRGAAVTTGNLGDVAFFLGDYERARRQYAAGLALREKLGDERGVLWSLCCNAIAANTVGEYAAGLALAERAVALAEKLGDEPRLAFALTYWADA